MLILLLLLVDRGSCRHNILHLVIYIRIHVRATDDIRVVSFWYCVIMALSVLMSSLLSFFRLEVAFLDLL